MPLSVQALCMLPQSLSLCVSPAVCKDSFPGVLSHLWLLQSFCIESWGEKLTKASHLGMSDQKSFILHFVQLWVFVLYSVYCSKKLLSWWMRKTLLYGYSRMPLGVMLLLCSFSRTIVFGFSLDYWPIWPQVLGHPNSINALISFHGVNKPQFQSESSWFLLQPLQHSLTSILHRQFYIVDWRICSWVGVYLSPLVACRVWSNTMTSL